MVNVRIGLVIPDDDLRQNCTRLHLRLEKELIRAWNGISPKLHPRSYVNEMAYVSGDVVIGDKSTVWPAAVIRAEGTGSISIGANTHIQDGSILHNSHESLRIGDNVNVGHSVVIHCSSIGDNCLIGNNSTLLEGVELGNYCLVASNAVVLNDTKVPDASFLAGVPATIRPLNANQRLMLETTADGIADTVTGYPDADRHR